MGIKTLFLALNDTHIEKVFFPILTTAIIIHDHSQQNFLKIINILTFRSEW